MKQQAQIASHVNIERHFTWQLIYQGKRTNNIDEFHITWWPWKPMQLDGHFHFTSLSRIYLSRIVEKVPKNLSSYAPDQDEGNKQQCN